MKLSVFTALNLLSGLLVYSIVLKVFITGDATDAYTAALVIVQFLLSIWNTIQTTTLIPLLARDKDTNVLGHGYGIALIAGLCAMILALLLYVAAGMIVPLLFAAFDVGKRDLTISLMQIEILAIPLACVFSVFQACAHVTKKAHLTEMTLLLANMLIAILLLGFGRSAEIILVPWLDVGKYAMLTLCAVYILGKSKPLVDSGFLREYRDKALPVILGSAYTRLNPLVERVLAGMSMSGHLSLFHLLMLGYSGANTLIYRIFTVPGMAEGIHGYNREVYAKKKRLFVLVAVFLIAAGMLVFYLLEGVIRRQLGITPGTPVNLWVMLLGLALIPTLLGQLSAAYFYVRGKTHTPMLVGAIGYTFSIVAKVVLFMEYGVSGLIVGIILHQFFNFIVLDRKAVST